MWKFPSKKKKRRKFQIICYLFFFKTKPDVHREAYNTHKYHSKICSQPPFHFFFEEKSRRNKTETGRKSEIEKAEFSCERYGTNFRRTKMKNEFFMANLWMAASGEVKDQGVTSNFSMHSFLCICYFLGKETLVGTENTYV